MKTQTRNGVTKRQIAWFALLGFAVFAFAFPARAGESAAEKFIAEVVAKQNVIADAFQANTVVATSKQQRAPDRPAVRLAAEVEYRYEQKPEYAESYFSLSNYGLAEPDTDESRSN